MNKTITPLCDYSYSTGEEDETFPSKALDWATNGRM